MGGKDIATISRQSWLTFFRDMQQIKNVQTGEEPILEQANRAITSMLRPNLSFCGN